MPARTAHSCCCSQNDIHSPNVTVHESLLFSARLRFTKSVERDIVDAFVEEVTLFSSYWSGICSSCQLQLLQHVQVRLTH